MGIFDELKKLTHPYDDEDEEYAVVRSSGSSEKTRLRSGDTVIAVARNLYDGKVVS